MRSSWAQPSLSRDFALLSAGILFILFLISALGTYFTYINHLERISVELETESQRIERVFSNEMENANYLLTALGREVVLENDRNFTKIAQTLKSFDSKGYIYTILTWINPDQQVVVSSNHGVLEKPVDVSDREYIKKTVVEPWKMHIGRPIEGRVSGRWIVPVSMGLTDYTGKFIGTIMISMDISTLTEHLSGLVKRDGISFAIVSKTLIPLTEISDEKDFVTNNFPTQKLMNVNFSNTPSGLISEGSMFWGTGNYSYYRVSKDYPYIILLGYNARYSDEAVRSMLWSRLLQMMSMAIFLVAFLWIMRIRMIRPVLDMTLIASAIAKGKPYTKLPTGGPVEIEGLATQVNAIGDYIAETKRIENELRNKMFMLKQAKERAEIDRRSKSEFLAYACQEMRNPLTNLVGFAQVMRDQLYGPIENRRYRQYASDIYKSGNHLLQNLQELQTLSKMETGYTGMTEKPLDVAATLQKIVRFMADKMQSEKQQIKLHLQEPLPKLIADEFRLQQICNNLLLYILESSPPEQTVTLHAQPVSENRDRMFLILLITTSQQPGYSQQELMALIEHAIDGAHHANHVREPKADSENGTLTVELARLLMGMQQSYFHMEKSQNGAITMALVFAGNRLQFSDSP